MANIFHLLEAGADVTVRDRHRRSPIAFISKGQMVVTLWGIDRLLTAAGAVGPQDREALLEQVQEFRDELGRRLAKQASGS